MIVTLLSSCKKLSPLHPSVIIYILPLGFGAGVGFMLGPGFGAYCKLKKKNIQGHRDKKRVNS